MSDPPLSVQALPESYLIATRDHLKLSQFLAEDNTRRRRYFELLEHWFDMTERFFNYKLSAKMLRPGVAAILSLDPGFRRFIVDQGATDELRDRSKCEVVHEAAAGIILAQYLDACQKGEWP